MTEFGMVT